MIHRKCRIAERQQVSDDTVILTFEDEYVAKHAQPGQFVNIEAGQFLKRPFGVMDCDPAKGTFRIGIKKVGVGTEYLMGVGEGTELKVVGPLGNGFQFEGVHTVITCGGGTGVFPLYYVLKKHEEMFDRFAVVGFKNKEEAFYEKEHKELAERCVYASDTGGLDFHGNAAQALEQLLEDLSAENYDFSRTAILTCGPMPMMRAVANLAERYGVGCQVSLEERMACGVGICLVCVCKIHGDDGVENQRCCHEGPVFFAEDVVWED